MTPTTQTTTMIAIIAPCDIWTPPVLSPEAPASAPDWSGPDPSKDPSPPVKDDSVDIGKEAVLVAMVTTPYVLCNSRMDWRW